MSIIVGFCTGCIERRRKVSRRQWDSPFSAPSRLPGPSVADHLPGIPRRSQSAKEPSVL